MNYVPLTASGCSVAKLWVDDYTIPALTKHEAILAHREQRRLGNDLDYDNVVALKTGLNLKTGNLFALNIRLQQDCVTSEEEYENCYFRTSI